MRKKDRSVNGFALISSLLITFVAFSFSIPYFNILVMEKKMGTSSEKMQKAEAVAEAGIEQAMWEYNYNGASFASWSIAGNTATKISSGYNPIGDYTVSVADYNSSAPIITSTSSYENLGVNKQVRIKCALASQSLFTKAIKADGLITVSGHGEVDSYNSSLGPYGGANTASNGDIQTNSTADPAVNVIGNCTIQGDVVSGPGGVIALSSGTTVTGAVSEAAPEALPTNVVPTTLSSLGLSPDMNSTQTISVSGAYNYKCQKIDLSGSNTVTFSGSGTVNLYLTGDATTSFNTGGNAKLVIGPGVNVVIYADKEIKINGTGIVNNNLNQDASSLQIYGTSSCGKYTVNGTSAFIGMISAPQAEGNTSGNADVYGAFVASTFNLSGTGKIHYDENLVNSGPSNGKKLLWYTRL